MQLILFMGVPASGKSSFYKQRYVDSHVRINLDMLRTRHRESVLFRACLEGKADMVVDNTNLTRAQRADYIRKARTVHFDIVGIYFESTVADALARNALRSDNSRVPDKAILSAFHRLEIPDRAEGFDQLSRVRLQNGLFEVEGWPDAF